MVEIANNGIITLNRGDTFQAPLFINHNNNLLEPYRYLIKETDIIYFGICEPAECFENAIVKKKYTIKDVNENKDFMIDLKAEDTLNLIPGTYYYEIKLQTIDSNELEKIVTVTPKTKLILLA